VTELDHFKGHLQLDAGQGGGSVRPPKC